MPVEGGEVLEAALLEAVIIRHGTGEVLVGGGGVDGEVLDEAEPAGLGLVAAEEAAELLGGAGSAGYTGDLGVWGDGGPYKVRLGASSALFGTYQPEDRR